jgi:broad specificity phosphatase PhoE
MAPTILSAEDRFAGSTDVDLSEEGRDQARGLAERLAPKPLSAAFASPMKRTMETASIVAAPHGLTPVPVDGLREIDHGRWEGMRRSEVEAQFPWNTPGGRSTRSPSRPKAVRPG